MRTEKNIVDTCLKYGISHYSINPDRSIDVDGNVNLSSNGLTVLPLQFGRVMGHFNVQDNLLNTLAGSPVGVGGNFNCFNNLLNNFLGGPKWIGGDFYAYNNRLTSLHGSAAEVVGSYYIAGNSCLANLTGCTAKIGGDFSFNDILLSTYSGDDDIEFYGEFFLSETHYNGLNTRKLPDEILQNIKHIKLVLKYQRYFYVWNDDLSFNRENFNILIGEIEDGLQ
jgi:hypothetical protein